MKDPHLPEPTYGALDRTAELLAKLLSGSEDPDVTALSEAVKAKLGITEPLPQPALASPSPRLSTLAEDLKRSRVSRLLPKVTCPSPFHPRARTVPIADLQDLPLTETEKRALSALAPLAGVSPPPSGLTPGGRKSGRPIAQANIQLESPEFDPKNLPEWAEEFAEFLLLTGQSLVDVASGSVGPNFSHHKARVQAVGWFPLGTRKQGSRPFAAPTPPPNRNGAGPKAGPAAPPPPACLRTLTAGRHMVIEVPQGADAERRV